MIDKNTQTWRAVKDAIAKRIEELKQELWDGPINREPNSDAYSRVRIDELNTLLETFGEVNE